MSTGFTEESTTEALKQAVQYFNLPQRFLHFNLWPGGRRELVEELRRRGCREPTVADPGPSAVIASIPPPPPISPTSSSSSSLSDSMQWEEPPRNSSSSSSPRRPDPVYRSRLVADLVSESSLSSEEGGGGSASPISPPSSPPTQTCQWCQQPSEGEVQGFGCEHFFCLACISNIMQSEVACPMCSPRRKKTRAD